MYVATARDSKALYAKISCPADADDETKKKAIRNQHLSEYGTEIGKLLQVYDFFYFYMKCLIDLANKVALDMLVLGAVVASKTGQRIGRGNGYVDLDFGILSKSGAITDKTIIVATVHDEQVNQSQRTKYLESKTKFSFPYRFVIHSRKNFSPNTMFQLI